MQLKHPKGHPLCMPAAAAAVPVAGGPGTTLPSIDIARTLAKKTIDAAITGKSQQTLVQNCRNVQHTPGSLPPNVAPRAARPHGQTSHPADPIFAAHNLAPKPYSKDAANAAPANSSPSPTRLKKSSRSGYLPPPTPNAGYTGEQFGILADLDGTVYSSRLSVMVKDAAASKSSVFSNKRFLEKPEGLLGGE